MFPSTISTFPIVSPTDRLNNPSHSALHNSVSSVVTQIQTIIGTDSSTLGTITGDLRNPASDGGGHVQTAVKGGTGQTTYAKGNLLVASSPSVLTKLTVGIDGQVPVADSSVATGIKWATAPGTRIATSGSMMVVSTTSLLSGATNASLFSVNVPASTLGVTGALRVTAFISDITMVNTPSVLLRAIYGNSTVASVLLGIGDQSTSIAGTFKFNLLAGGATNLQRGNLQVDIGQSVPSITGLGNAQQEGIHSFNTGTSIEDTGGVKVIGFTAVNGLAGQPEDGRIEINGYIVERIV